MRLLLLVLLLLAGAALGRVPGKTDACRLREKFGVSDLRKVVRVHFRPQALVIEDFLVSIPWILRPSGSFVQLITGGVRASGSGQ